jgi:type II secretory pathway component GspD/PulD (secretin)
MKSLLALLLALYLGAPTVQADSITTMVLHNRPAEEIIPLLKPMLGPDDAISGQGFQLFIRAPAATRAQIQELLTAVDVAAKMLQISVFQGERRELRALRIEGGIHPGHNPEHSGAGGIGFSTRNTDGGINIAASRARLQDNPVHRLRVSDGGEGYIETGTAIPYFSGYDRVAPDARAGGIEYKNITTGFYVHPRLRGEQVILSVSPFKQSPDPRQGGNIRIQNARTTITGPLGEWLPIGGTTEQTQQSRSRIDTLGSTHSRNDTGTWIKADLVP